MNRFRQNFTYATSPLSMPLSYLSIYLHIRLSNNDLLISPLCHSAHFNSHPSQLPSCGPAARHTCHSQYFMMAAIELSIRST